MKTTHPQVVPRPMSGVVEPDGRAKKTLWQIFHVGSGSHTLKERFTPIFQHNAIHSSGLKLKSETRAT